MWSCGASKPAFDSLALHKGHHRRSVAQARAKPFPDSAPHLKAVRRHRGMSSSKAVNLLDAQCSRERAFAGSSQGMSSASGGSVEASEAAPEAELDEEEDGAASGAWSLAGDGGGDGGRAECEPQAGPRTCWSSSS